jgi:hypothetical protein
MSDFFLSLIPDDPTYVPPVEARAQALAALRARLPPPAQVEAQVFDEVTFIDQGSNFEKVLCPACEEDITEHWAGLMQAASESEFSDLSLSMPCCGRLTNLNALSYIPPAGFARFSLRAMNPNMVGCWPQRMCPLWKAYWVASSGKSTRATDPRNGVNTHRPPDDCVRPTSII